MHPKIELDSVTISKSEADLSSFIKYDVDAALDEVTVTEKLSKLKFSFSIISDPKNIRLVADGFATIEGTESERGKILENDGNGIPKILNLIYQDLFANFFMLSKSIKIPCPPHSLGKITKSSADPSEQKVEEIKTEEGMGFGSATKEKEAKPEEAKPEEIKTEDNFENLPYEELTPLYEKLTKEYTENPSDKLSADLGKISELLQKGPQNKEKVEATQV